MTKLECHSVLLIVGNSPNISTKNLPTATRLSFCEITVTWCKHNDGHPTITDVFAYSDCCLPCHSTASLSAKSSLAECSALRGWKSWLNCNKVSRNSCSRNQGIWCICNTVLRLLTTDILYLYFKTYVIYQILNECLYIWCCVPFIIKRCVKILKSSGFFTYYQV